MRRKIFMALVILFVFAAVLAAAFGFMDWNSFTQAEVMRLSILQRFASTVLWAVPVCLLLSLVSLEIAMGTDAGGVILSALGFLLALGALAAFGVSASLRSYWLFCGAMVLTGMFLAVLLGRLKASGRAFAVTGLAVSGILSLTGAVFSIRELLAYDPSLPSYIYQETAGFQVIWAAVLPLGLALLFGGLALKLGRSRICGGLSVYWLIAGVVGVILAAVNKSGLGVCQGILALALSLGFFQGYLGRGFESLMLGQALFFGAASGCGVIYLIYMGGAVNAAWGFIPFALVLAALSARQIWRSGEQKESRA